MVAWVHSFRKWTWLTFAIGFAAASWSLWSGAGSRWLLASGLTAMIGAALLVGLRRRRYRARRLSACCAQEVACRQVESGSDEQSVSPVAEAPVCRVRELVDTLMSEGRYALVLRPQIAGNLDPSLLALARQRLDQQMAMVPQGAVLVEPHLVVEQPITSAEAAASQGCVVHVAAAYLDRCTVTNRQFQVFVTAGGYDQMAIWDPTIWPAVLDFVDATGHPGPRYWQHGRFPPGKADHPVVGVSWYEAAAYARWVGKRLPSDAEWLKAGCWPVQLSPESRHQRKFPWGNAMDRSRANLWGSGPGDTTAVDDFGTGTSVGGVNQLIGNVWEWTAADFELPLARRRDADEFSSSEFAADRDAAMPRAPLKTLRGGAFDTYFDHQATCQFASGDNPLARKYNVGFRLALGICDLIGTDEVEASPQRAAEPEPIPDSEELLQLA